MSRTFNCGIGMVLIVDEEHVAEITALLMEVGEKVFRVGALVPRTEISGEHSVLVENAERAW